MEEKQQRGGPGGRRSAPMAPIQQQADPRRSRSLEYGTAILRSYSARTQALGVAEIAELVGISRSTAHRYAMTLVALGHLEQDSKRKYRLAPQAGNSGRAAIETIRAEVGGGVVLRELRDELGHTVSMGVLCGSRVVYVQRLFGHRRGQFAIDRSLEVGASVPVHCTAIGKVLLASMAAPDRERLLAELELELEPHGPKAILDRAQLAATVERIGAGDAVLSDEEELAGARSLAVRVPGSRGGHTVAIDVTVPSAAYTAAALRKRAGPSLHRAASLIGTP